MNSETAELTLDGVSFQLCPTIGHCLKMKAAGVDLLGEKSELEKLVASPLDFLKCLEIVISDQAAKADDPDRFQGDALAGLLDGPTWTTARMALLRGFIDFFREGGKTEYAAALEALRKTADDVTARVAESLTNGALKAKIDQAVNQTLEDLEASEIGG